MSKATFGAGCFWAVEAAFRGIEGVTATAVGYLGGDFENPRYEDVCIGRTGHAEVVEITFDPALTDYNTLLDVFWRSHDPTTLNRQGPDIGEQYRSVIFFHDQNQRQEAEASKRKRLEAALFEAPIVTEISPATTFYRAEDCHQQYLEKRRLMPHSGPVR